MKRGKSSVSEAKSYRQIGDFWDTHDLSDFWNQTKSVDFDLNIESEITYYSLDKRLAEEVRPIAQKRGVSADTLINLWVQEKIQEQNR
jgi:CopG antitoxin of type II toxin-antitoxin system